MFCALAASFVLSVLFSGFVTDEQQAMFVLRIGFSLGCLTALAFLSFSFSFIGGGRKAWVCEVVGVLWAGLLLVLFWGTRLVIAGAYASEYSNYSPRAGPLISLYGLFLVYGLFISLALFIKAYRNSTGHKRIQTAYMLFGFVIFVIAGFGSLLPSLGAGSLLASLPILLFLFFPLIISYAIIRHRLWDIRTVLHRTIAWIVLIIALSVPVYLLLWAAASHVKSLSQVDLTVVLTLLFFLCYFYLKTFKPKIDHVFQRRMYDRQQVLERFDREMVSIRSAQEVTQQLLGTLSQTVYPQFAAVYYNQKDHGTWAPVVVPENFDARLPGFVDPRDSLFEHIRQVGLALDQNQIELDVRYTSVREVAKEFFADSGIHVCLPLVQSGLLVGLVCLGENSNLKNYTRGDLEFLEQLGVSASIGLSNALLFDQVDAQRRDLQDLTSNLELRVQVRTKELQSANERLLDLDRLKSEFFANVSHELRTPLSLILAPLDSMLEEFGEYSEGQRQQLDGIQRNALVLMKLVDDLLDLSKLEEARLELDLTQVNLADLVSNIIGTARPLAERKRVALKLECLSRPLVVADARKIERVLINLLSNALKFSDPGALVELTVDQDEQKAWVQVKDNGIGIPPDEVESVFDRFHQVDSSKTSRFGGTGIGLALAKELVELHTGSLTIESQLHQGSTFRMALPLRLTDLSEDEPEFPNAAAQPGSSLEWSDEIRSREEYRFVGIVQATEQRLAYRSKEGSGQKLARILVVDDNPEMLAYLEQELGEKYDVKTMTDGKQAVRLIGKEHHDLVISDVMMPGMSGLELCQRIKTDPRVQDTPIILLTARGGEQGRIEGHWVGADLYLTKPFRPAELQAAIEAQLASRSRRVEIAAHKRAASLETLLAGLAHELRNATHQAQSSQMAAWSLLEKVSGSHMDEGFTHRLEKMKGISRRALDRIGAVVLSLQRYAFKRMQVPWSEVDFDELIRKETARLTLAEEKGVKLELALNSRVSVRGPNEELRQMVLNMVENAIQAVDPGGWVKVSTAAMTGHVRLSIKDNGCGIPPSDQERIFDLFFTSKDPDKGIGLGLALCQRTIADVGGKVSVNSKVGQGTEFVIEIPRVEPEHRNLS
jgi:signal transduction histidine kinase